MSERRHRTPGRFGSGHEDWLAGLVRRSGADEERFEFYLAFARELELSLRRERLLRHEPGAFPDFSRQTKRVVMKWFKRGLSGRVLARIGAALGARLDETEVDDGTGTAAEC
ncbi:hypothetical protein JXB37_05875 [candidate division WOR-3 bacterium]|nr:hypothetical protein [candidate division WOR-3 bacterium]